MLDPANVFGAAMAAAVGSVDPAGIAAWEALAAVINAQIVKAELVTGSLTVPITGAAGTTPVAEVTPPLLK